MNDDSWTDCFEYPLIFYRTVTGSPLKGVLKYLKSEAAT